ncbi:hypothetical protein K7432_012768 [Basidiobolus ranarum]|uniref:Peptidase S1 domain-containing protein n=1 Tax=Basidiobolus ranarum TaxID=34480 RepID=A0ABR2VRT3_9FUNG
MRGLFIQWLTFLGWSINTSGRTIVNYSFVIGGKEVKRIEEFPFICHLFIKDNPTCGGSIIDENWILTAGHCLFQQEQSLSATYESKDIKVVIGNRANTALFPLSVSYFVIHPEFDNVLLKNDIALLKVSTKMIFNPQVNSIKISQERIKVDEDFIALGWGETEEGKESTYLKEAKINSSKRVEKCRNHLENYQDNNGLQICAESTDSDTCYGDSGGPLVSMGYPNELVGITSYAASWNSSTKLTCGGQGTLGIYTHVYPYMDFISQHTSLSSGDPLQNSSPKISFSAPTVSLNWVWAWIWISCLFWNEML